MTQFANLQGTHTAYELRGSGPAIVLMHGAEANRHSFDALAEALALHAQVVIYDQRECGETVNKTGEHHIPELAEDAAELMGHLGHARYSVFGTSLGGRIAQALAIAYPQRVQSLSLCNTWPLDRSLPELNPEGMARMQSLRAGLPETAGQLASMFYTPEHVARHPALTSRFASAMPGKRSALAQEVHALDPARIQSPTLCISGSLDQVVPANVMQALAGRIPGAAWESLEGIGHSAAVQAPGLLAQAIVQFLLQQPDF
ncbi:alpha/beta fold hydrolase [Variovorax sp. OV329]|uniref:alpha/beta fold hydrolase n=1 Tax=Variovorax sp. OV329 TaxID=1882825 RepID=UPI0008F2B1C8|nr:alpha/beta hydrolase [Variovorax sp. OV329]SFM92679.1 Pimeloyl-ACP methyl ester carboxylesterase [Variovorax sp. OV329]